MNVMLVDDKLVNYVRRQQEDSQPMESLAEMMFLTLVEVMHWLSSSALMEIMTDGQQRYWLLR